jgi:hypothetical protein
MRGWFTRWEQRRRVQVQVAPASRVLLVLVLLLVLDFGGFSRRKTRRRMWTIPPLTAICPEGASHFFLVKVR